MGIQDGSNDTDVDPPFLWLYQYLKKSKEKLRKSMLLPYCSLIT
jgi:hypothetical protein